MMKVEFEGRIKDDIIFESLFCCGLPTLKKIEIIPMNSISINNENGINLLKI